MMQEINVKDTTIRTTKVGETDYICITDIARQKNPIEPNIVVGNWMRNRNTIEYLGIWEYLNNPDFNPIEFEGFKQQAGLNAFTLSPSRWIEATNAIGLIAKSGRYGGTYAQRDIAFKFASWVSVENVALFGITAKEWREANPDKKGNMRDYATINHLICLSNMENLNAVFINEGIPQRDRLHKLNKIAIQQMTVLEEVGNRKLLK